MIASLLSTRPFSLPKRLYPCNKCAINLIKVVVSLCCIAVLLWLGNGYHAGFQTINSLGSLLPDSLWASITLIGDTRVSLALLLFFVYRYPLFLPAALVASIPATLLTQSIKHLTEIHRPVAELGAININQIGDLLTLGSFPSGHSATIAVLAGLLLMISKNAAHRRALLCVMLLVGASRVMVGAHYPIDVLIGLSIGLLCAYFGLYIANTFQLMRHKVSQWLMLSLPFLATYLVFQHNSAYPQGELFARSITLLAVMGYFHHRLQVYNLYRHQVSKPLKLGFGLIKHPAHKLAQHLNHFLKVLCLNVSQRLVYCSFTFEKPANQVDIKAQYVKAEALLPFKNTPYQSIASSINQPLKISEKLLSTVRTYTLNTVNFLRRRDVVLFFMSFVVFTSFPSIDLTVSGLFYDDQLHAFTYKNQALVYFIYKLVSQLPIILLLVLPVLAWKRYQKYPKNDVRKIRNTFLLVCLLLGPGLLVNTIIKDHSIGRARPVQVHEFSGSKTFTPAFINAGQCTHNCSFVSGHAAMGFYFIALGWVFASRRWFYTGLTIGIFVGLGRVIQGGHFISDVVFAFWAVYFVTSLLGKVFNLSHPLCWQGHFPSWFKSNVPLSADKAIAG